MINIRSPDSICNCSESAVHGGMAVTCTDKHSWKNFSSFHHDDMFNALLWVAVIEDFKIKIRAVFQKIFNLGT